MQRRGQDHRASDGKGRRDELAHESLYRGGAQASGNEKQAAGGRGAEDRAEGAYGKRISGSPHRKRADQRGAEQGGDR